MKSGLLSLILAELGGRLSRLSKAAIEAHAAATDPGSRAEGKYDTRSLEASYLATGQARQVEELADAVRRFGALSLPDFDMDDPIEAGALVEVEMAGETVHFLLAPAAGGLTVVQEGREVTLLAPGSELYGKLLGKRVGDMLDDPPLEISEVA